MSWAHTLLLSAHYWVQVTECRDSLLCCVPDPDARAHGNSTGTALYSCPGCSSEREQHPPWTGKDFSSSHRKQSPHTASSPSSHLSSQQLPGRSLEELQVRDRVDGACHMEVLVWRTCPERQTHRDRVRWRKRRGRGIPCEQEGEGRGHENMTPLLGLPPPVQEYHRPFPFMVVNSPRL